VLTVLMKTQPSTIVQHLSHALMINSHARTVGVLTKAGFVITITIAVMVQMKENSVMLNTRHAHLKNLLARISSALEINIVVMVSFFKIKDELIFIILNLRRG
jgi:hypothetical protein